jgi:hypothetical protein
MENKIRMIEDLICTFEGSDLVTINNAFCQNANYFDNEYYEFDDEFFEIFFNGKPMDLASSIFFGNIQNWGDEWLYFNGYGNIESTNTPTYCESTYNIAEHIFENSSKYYGLNAELDSILDNLND